MTTPERAVPAESESPEDQGPTEVHQDLTALREHYTNPRRNRAMKIEDRWHQLRLNLARRKQQHVTMLSLTGYGSPRWVRVFSRVVMAPDTDFENGRRVAKVIADGVRGWRNFVSAPVPFAEVTVTIAGRSYEVSADRGGIVDVQVDLGEDLLEPGWQEVRLEAAGAEATTAEVQIIGDDVTSGVICDIDDTVVVTKLPRPFLAAWNSFVLDEHARTPTPGMAVMMERLLGASPGAPVIYVSTGAWNVAQTLTRFLTRNLYPFGPLLLTDWGPTEDRWFRSGQQHKDEQLERLHRDYPQIKWVLMGDDGQHDPVIYADFARRHPQAVQAVIIRELTYSEAVLAGGRAEPPDGEDLLKATNGGENPQRVQTVGQYQIPWIYGPDGKAISEQLSEQGLLGPSRH
ncbi:DUF2183 domain-containing protein [Nesterenkonia massiliensis]|uniref:DUF2183 domain-containing protein n=1 Tax=Nesterenkonia massiliensis TaxID=1232429 RepID=A0ABT2HQK1_9MICC|nr:phosphatase domain-containing protein [Nesterenkonia massiliensis]MCT1606966.1 DUF2183 domain-containing protein [Nesterenkonia massiliensis]